MPQDAAFLLDPGNLCICVDMSHPEAPFRLHHCSLEEPKRFKDLAELLLGIEEIFNGADFPQSSTELRTFGKKREAQKKDSKEKIGLMAGNMINELKGESATFIVKVQYRQNSTWQGTVIWTEKNKKQALRRALELLKLIDGALDESGISEK